MLFTGEQRRALEEVWINASEPLKDPDATLADKFTRIKELDELRTECVSSIFAHKVRLDLKFNFQNRVAIIEWCKAYVGREAFGRSGIANFVNDGGEWGRIGPTYYFAEAADAVHFKMRWY